MTAFPSYRPLVSDWDSFQNHCSRPQPEFFRVNRLKTTEKYVREYLEQQEISFESVSPLESVYRWMETDRNASETVLHWNGSYYIQDPVTVLPVYALAPDPGETVLDLCASPGGKTFLISQRVGKSGRVIANEPNPGRQISLNGNIQRMGATNVAISGYDGQSVPEHQSFSAILVDAPCSGEGAFRQTGQELERVSQQERAHLVHTQKMLIAKAYKLLKPGGRLVYATCSFAPEENEAVVADLLNDSSARIDPIKLDLPHDPGTRTWENQTFPEAVQRIWRVYPHHYDGGGIVFARVSKPGGEEQ